MIEYNIKDIEEYYQCNFDDLDGSELSGFCSKFVVDVDSLYLILPKIFITDDLKLPVKSLFSILERCIDENNLELLKKLLTSTEIPLSRNTKIPIEFFKKLIKTSVPINLNLLKELCNNKYIPIKLRFKFAKTFDLYVVKYIEDPNEEIINYINLMEL